MKKITKFYIVFKKIIGIFLDSIFLFKLVKVLAHNIKEIKNTLDCSLLILNNVWIQTKISLYYECFVVDTFPKVVGLCEHL
jgi:hypothetical protein